MKTKVMVGGAFDILHYGHICLFKWCKSLGDILIVQIVGDKRIKYKKGKDRPIFPEKERVAIIKAIKYVDDIFLSRYPVRKNPVLKAIKTIKPDIYVRNYEGNNETLEEEEELCKRMGIKIVFHRDFPHNKKPIHSSEIINYMKR